MSTPSLCGGFLSSKRSLVAFIWSITTLMTFVAFLMAIVMIIQIHMQYKRMERMYATYDDDDYAADQEGEEGNPEDKEEDNNESLMYELLASTSSRSMTFVGIYTMMLALALNLYGSTAIVGFTSLRGVYIAPCFSTENSSMRVGMFGGAIVIFANLLLLCAVILGEFRVEDYRDDRDKEEFAPYAVERIATVLAVTCMFLSVLYTTFAVLLFLSHCSRQDDCDDLDDGPRHSKPLVTMADRENGGFLTMDESRSS